MKKRECYLVGGGLGNTGVAGARRVWPRQFHKVRLGQAARPIYITILVRYFAPSQDRAILPNTGARCRSRQVSV